MTLRIDSLENELMFDIWTEDLYVCPESINYVGGSLGIQHICAACIAKQSNRCALRSLECDVRQ